MHFFIGLAVALCVVGASACSARNYASKDLPGNFTIAVDVDGGSALTKMENSLDVQLVKQDCEYDFLGRVYLDRPKEMIGLPAAQKLFLEAHFVTSGPFSATGVLRHATLFTARPGVNYLAEIIYRKSIYSVEIFELGRTGGKGRLVERVDPNSCIAETPGGSK
jgi:hypothetical protein